MAHQYTDDDLTEFRQDALNAEHYAAEHRDTLWERTEDERTALADATPCHNHMLARMTHRAIAAWRTR